MSARPRLRPASASPGPAASPFLSPGLAEATRLSAHAMASSLLLTPPARTICSLPPAPNWSLIPPRRGSAASRWPVHRWIIRATQGSSGSPPAATEVQKERKRCLRCGGMYLDEENHPNACAFHGHVTGISSRVESSWYGDLGLRLIPRVGTGLPPRRPMYVPGRSMECKAHFKVEVK
jgi:hypothetical protein